MAPITRPFGLKTSLGWSFKEHMAKVSAAQADPAEVGSQFGLSHIPEWLFSTSLADVLGGAERDNLGGSIGSAQEQRLQLALGEHLGRFGAAQDGAVDSKRQADPSHVLERLAAKLDDIVGLPGQADLHSSIGSDQPMGLKVASGLIWSIMDADAKADLGDADVSTLQSLLGRPARGEVASANSAKGTLDIDAGWDDVSGGGYGALGFPDAEAGDAISPRGGAPADKAPIELLVQFTPGAAAPEFAAAAAALGGRVVETIHTSVMEDAGRGVLVRMTFGQGLTAEQALRIASKIPGVELAEPNWEISVQAISNDDYYMSGSMWGTYSEQSHITDSTVTTNQFGSQAHDAWAAGYTGSTGLPSKTVVGVIDTGIDYTHPDLYLNIWINQNEITDALWRLTGNRLFLDHDGDGQITFYDLNNNNATFLAKTDDFVTDVNTNGRIDAYDLLNSRLADKTDAASDSNAMVDDLVGWDFVNNDNNPFDDRGHGTHVAGTVGAIGGNDTGVVGVAWDVQMMALKFLNADGSGSTSGAIQAVDYYTAASKDTSAAGVDQNFAATNNSWGGGGYSDLLLQSIVEGAKVDSLFIAAAGNGGSDGVGDDNDATPRYPASYDTTAGAGYDAVIAVASITSSGSLSSFSNYGATSVELGAPGSSIYSTLPGGTDPAIANSGKYGSYNGTSMATPHVAGAIALYAALNPTASAADIRNALLASTAPTASLDGKTLSNGRLDVGTLLGSGSRTGTSTSVITGTDGSDVLTGTSGSDLIDGGLGDDTLSGGDGDDKLLGGGGNDLLDGGAGTDHLEGGTGNDTYILAEAGDSVVEGLNEGIDQVNAGYSYTLGNYVENLLLTGTSAINGTGNASANQLEGNAANNILRGGDGNDTLTGEAGDDTLYGDAGNDTLYGGTGTDRLEGGAGNDTYLLAASGDTVVEGSGAGIDQVNAYYSYTLGSYVENLLLSGTSAISGTGNAYANRITGNSAANNLKGAGGNDTLEGGDGDDVLTGGAGQDALTGGAGSDDFVYLATSDSISSSTARDTIADFARDYDGIVVSNIDANTKLKGNQAFALDTNGSFSAGEIRQTVLSGGVLVEFNTDRDSTAEMAILLQGLTSALVGTDFVL